MSDLERITKYIGNHRNPNWHYELSVAEMNALRALCEKSRLDAICLAFEYGRAKGRQEAAAAARQEKHMTVTPA